MGSLSLLHRLGFSIGFIRDMDKKRDLGENMKPYEELKSILAEKTILLNALQISEERTKKLKAILEKLDERIVQLEAI